MEDMMRNIGFALASLLRLPAVLAGLTLGGLIAGALTLGVPFLCGPAQAEAGDTLVVTGDSVNVRIGPSTNARVKMRVDQHQQVMELQRQGDWVRAEIAGSGGQDGWIHGSLLAPPEVVQVARPPAAPSEQQAVEAAPAPPREPAAAVAAVPAARETQAEAPQASRTGPAAIEPAAAPSGEGDPADLTRFRQSVDYLNSRAVSVAGVDLFTTVETVGNGVVQVAATEAWSTIPPAGQQSYANTLLDRWAAARGHGGPISVQIVAPDGQVLLERTRP
jgi:Bacterial SH3 domain